MTDVSTVESVYEALNDIYSGVTVGTAHSLKFLRKWISRDLCTLFGILGKYEQRSTAALEDGVKPKLKVVGVGFGRTGTHSLSLALEKLGFPTLHTYHLYENDEIFDMWTQEIVLPSIRANEASLGKPDFDLIASHGFTGTTDLPMALYYEQLHTKYPDCKFILTVRENSNIWFKSWDTLAKSITQPTRFAHFLTGVRRLGLYLRWLFSIINKDNNYLTVSYPLPDQNREASIASYEDHNRRVREVIPPDRLLEYNVKQGWEPLCNFLEIKDCPTIPFPKTNSARSVQVQTISAMIMPLAVLLFISFYLFSFGFQRLTGMTILEWVNYRIARFMHNMTPKELRQSSPPRRSKMA